VNRRRRALAALGFALFGSCLLRQLHAERPASPPIVVCEPAIEIDGRLHCGPAARFALARACGPELATAASGDAVRTDPFCLHAGRMAGADLEALGTPVDLNTASLPELESLPGIGPVLARRIAAARPFERVDSLRRVTGIGPVRLAALRRRARVAGRTKVVIAAPNATPVSLVSP
jgi:hypothetical protein